MTRYYSIAFSALLMQFVCIVLEQILHSYIFLYINFAFSGLIIICVILNFIEIHKDIKRIRIKGQIIREHQEQIKRRKELASW